MKEAPAAVVEEEPDLFSFAAAAEVPPAYSEATSQEIDCEVSKLISTAYRRAEELLAENKEKLERLATTLIERETMDGKEVEAIFSPAPAAETADEERECSSEEETAP